VLYEHDKKRNGAKPPIFLPHQPKPRKVLEEAHQLDTLNQDVKKLLEKLQ
jgi:hypothetical protein